MEKNNHPFFLDKLISALLLPLMLTLVAPFSFSFGNSDELSFSLSDVVLPAVGVFIALSIVFFSVLSVLSRYPTAYRVARGLSLGVAACLWIQSQVLIWPFGPLDGRGMDWARWRLHMWMEAVIWIALLIVATYIAIRSTRTIRHVERVTGLLAVLSLASGYWFDYQPQPKKDTVQFDNLFEFGKEHNILVIILDSFQSDYFDHIANLYPREVEFLDGFTYFQNTISGYPTTKANIPFLLSGVPYKNEKPFKDYLETEFKDKDIRAQLASIGYEVHYAGWASAVDDVTRFRTILDTLGTVWPPDWISFLDYGLFRCLPTAVKPYVYANDKWFLSRLFSADYPPSSHGRDIQFLELFEKRATIAKEDKKTFKILHFATPHFPLVMDENLKTMTGTMDRVDAYIRQARGGLAIVRRLLSKILSIMAYDATEVFVVSDHGSRQLPIRKTIGNTNPSITDVPDSVRSSSFALMLHKPVNARGPLIRNGTPLRLGDFKCLLGVDFPTRKHDCQEFESALSGKPRHREFYWYNWTHEGWKLPFLDDIQVFSLDGHAWDASNWSYGTRRFVEGEQYDMSVAPTYKIGTPIKFSVQSNPRHYLREGWSHQEKNHRWTEGNRAVVRFRLEKPSTDDLTLRMFATGYLANGRLKHQEVEVSVNRRPLTKWFVDKWRWYHVIIPSALTARGELTISFSISNATSPYEAGVGSGFRRLGIAVSSMIVEKNR